MGLATFVGGIHPHERKKYTMFKPTKELVPTRDLVFPMSQHIGAPAVPCVQPGDHVLKGAKIAEAGGFVSSPIISSVSGTVTGIESKRVINGSFVQSIIIENDYEYQTVPGYGTRREYHDLSKEEILNIIKDAGIVGLGGAGFPTHVKLAPNYPDKIDYIILNGAECEPYITSDYRMMLEQPDKIVEGLRIILSLFKNAKGIIAIENNKPEAIRVMDSYTANISDISVKALKTKYPQGGERMLIYALTGRKINSSMLPADAGVIVQNVATVAAIYDAVAYNKPLTTRIVSVTGDSVVDPQNYEAPIGTHILDLIDASGGYKGIVEKIVCGGMMMGTALFDTDVPIMKTTSAVVCRSIDKVSRSRESACIKCGRCVKACPEHLIPVMMMDAALHDDFDRFDHLNGSECIECGSCSYSCPAKRNLTQAFKNSKAIVAQKRKEAAAKVKEEAEEKARVEAEESSNADLGAREEACNGK